MDLSTLLLAAAAGTASLAVGATVWALGGRRGAPAEGAPATDAGTARSLEAAAEAFEIAVLSLSAGPARLAAGEESLALCAERLGVARPDAAGCDAQAVVARIASLDPAHGAQLKALVETGAPCAFEAIGPGGGVAVEGRVGRRADLPAAVAHRRRRGRPAQRRRGWRPSSTRAPRRPGSPAADGAPVFANQAWLDAAGRREPAPWRANGA